MGTNYIIILLGIFLSLAPVLPKGFIYRDRGNNKVKDVKGYIAAQIKLLTIMGGLFLIIGIAGIITGKSLFLLIIIPVIINLIGGIIISKKYNK